TAGQRCPAARVLNKTSALVGSVTASGIASGRALLGKVGLINEPKIAAEPTPDVPGRVKARSTRGHNEPAKTNDTAVLPSQPAPTSELPVQPETSVAPPVRAVVADPVRPDTKVYSADDSDVAPPTLVLPQLARTMPTGAGSSTPAAVIELLVNEAGMVETVKVL